jgi:5'/3'-nucleotidase
VPCALITNDDGVDSLGLLVLTQAALDLGLDVVVAAPEHESSGSSASLSAVGEDGRLLTAPIALPGLDVRAMAVGALPAFIVFAACQGVFGDPPDLVLSGVNHGPNLGQAVLHSGTVGAALTASVHGRKGLAMSTGVEGPTHADTVREVARQAITALLASEARTVLNVNVPDVADGELKGVRAATLAPFGAVQATVVGAGDDYVRLDVDPLIADAEPGTDVALLAEGWATVTPLLPVSEAAGGEVVWPTAATGRWEEGRHPHEGERHGRRVR